jgi:hypothetical protein
MFQTPEVLVMAATNPGMKSSESMVSLKLKFTTIKMTRISVDSIINKKGSLNWFCHKRLGFMAIL